MQTQAIFTYMIYWNFCNIYEYILYYIYQKGYLYINKACHIMQKACEHYRKYQPVSVYFLHFVFAITYQIYIKARSLPHIKCAWCYTHTKKAHTQKDLVAEKYASPGGLFGKYLKKRSSQNFYIQSVKGFLHAIYIYTVATPSKIYNVGTYTQCMQRI